MADENYDRDKLDENSPNNVNNLSNDVYLEHCNEQTDEVSPHFDEKHNDNVQKHEEVKYPDQTDSSVGNTPPRNQAATGLDAFDTSTDVPEMDFHHSSPITIGAKDSLNGDVKDHEPQEEKGAGSEPCSKPSLREYIFAELTKGYHLEQDEAKFVEKRQRVYTFMRIPVEMEKFILFGYFQCMDVFLHVFTFLPIRILLACLKLCASPFLPSRKPGRVLESAQICDILKGIILVTCCFLIQYMDVSMMYHMVRGQAIIKLYIFFNILEVFDRLFSSFGQDILDALFWTATEPRGRRREHIGVIPHLALAIVYVYLHTLLVLFQVSTLNVAFNSHSKVMLTIIMANNVS